MSPRSPSDAPSCSCRSVWSECSDANPPSGMPSEPSSHPDVPPLAGSSVPWPSCRRRHPSAAPSPRTECPVSHIYYRDTPHRHPFAIRWCLARRVASPGSSSVSAQSPSGSRRCGRAASRRASRRHDTRIPDGVCVRLRAPSAGIPADGCRRIARSAFPCLRRLCCAAGSSLCGPPSDAGTTAGTSASMSQSPTGCSFGSTSSWPRSIYLWDDGSGHCPSAPPTVRPCTSAPCRSSSRRGLWRSPPAGSPPPDCWAGASCRIPAAISARPFRAARDRSCGSVVSQPSHPVPAHAADPAHSWPQRCLRPHPCGAESLCDSIFSHSRSPSYVSLVLGSYSRPQR